MLPLWLKAPIRTHRAPATSPRSSPHFHRSSFKDIHSLLCDDYPQSQPYSQPNSPIFHRIRRVHPLPSSQSDTGSPVVLYFTSLRVVRRTFDDCRAVRSILRSFRIPVDERDVSMDSKFLDELVEAIGSKSKKKLTLPAVFVGDRYIGGVEEIKRLQESGELYTLIRGLPLVVNTRVCGSCGGLGFVVCNRCHGSNKIYGKCGFMECASCNINGLVRCRSCRPVHRRCT